MKTCLAIVACGALLAILQGCFSDPESPRGFRLPEGDAEQGLRAFEDLQCHTCHEVHGLELPPGTTGTVVDACALRSMSATCFSLNLLWRSGCIVGYEEISEIAKDISWSLRLTCSDTEEQLRDTARHDLLQGASDRLRFPFYLITSGRRCSRRRPAATRPRGIPRQSGRGRFLGVVVCALPPFFPLARLDAAKVRKRRSGRHRNQ